MKPFLLSFAITLAFACSHLSAQTSPEKPGAPAYDSIAAVLQANIDQTIELHLKSGEKIAGKVAKIGSNIVHVSQLTGMELFDADISIADIAAVVARARKG